MTGTRSPYRNRALVGPAAAAVALLALGGCALPHGTAGTAELPHPRVSTWQAHHEVTFPPGESSLTFDQQRRLEAFLAGAAPGGRDDLRIVVERSADSALDARRREALAAAIADAGVEARILPAAPSAPLTLAASPAAGAETDIAMVQVVRYRMHLPPCPDWSRARIGDYYNRKTSNFGCATATNLGVHVADPRDLGVGRIPGPADGERAVLSIQTYRAGEEGRDEPAGPAGFRPTGQMGFR